MSTQSQCGPAGADARSEHRAGEVWEVVVLCGICVWTRERRDTLGLDPRATGAREPRALGDERQVAFVEHPMGGVGRQPMVRCAFRRGD